MASHSQTGTYDNRDVPQLGLSTLDGDGALS